MVTIIPAILTNDPKELEEKLNRLGGIVQRVQIDIVDGVFANNKTILPDVLEGVETNLLIDFQLMTKEPKEWVERCVRGLADRIFGHVERMSSQLDFIGKVQEVGAKVGLALDLETPVSAIERVLFNNLDAVLVMSVKAGFGGHEFDPSVLEKIRQLDEIRARDDTPFRICVDGGINEKNIARV
ncbi:MAG: hypothetical protein AAB694_01330, partial [Patescibacteria group bacterium]